MIWKFLKEYIFWYLIYFLISFLYFLNFYLYRLPLSYFGASLALNLTVLIILSVWKFIQFKQKMEILQHFIYVNELEVLVSPLDKAYVNQLLRLKEAEAANNFEVKSQADHFQNVIKMWSHQMKVPLSVLSLMSQTDNLESKEVSQQLIRLEKYLDTLLNYTKFNQNKDDFRFEECSVNEIITELVKKYRISFLAKHLSIAIQGDWIVKSDKKWLSFALSQILDNAIKYSNENGAIKIVINEHSIIISDNGIGILEEDLPRLFDEGFTGYNGHEHKKATGLGLYMTKQVLDKLNFEVSITSQLDVGTEVRIVMANSKF